MLDRIAQGHAVDGMEALSPVLVDGMELLVDVLPGRHPGAGLRSRAGPRPGASTWSSTSEEFLQASWAAAAGGGKAPIDLGASAYQPLADVRGRRPRPRSGLVDAVAVQRRCRADEDGPGSAPTTARSSTSAPASAGRASSRGPIAGPPQRHLPRRHRGGGRRDRPPVGRRLARWCWSPRARASTARMAEVLTEHEHPGARSGPRSTRPPPPGWSTVVHGRAATRVRRRRRSGWPCSPPATCPVSGPPTRRPARCRPGARTRSTRSS